MRVISENFPFNSGTLFMIGISTKFSIYHLAFDQSMSSFESPRTYNLSIPPLVAHFTNPWSKELFLLFVPYPTTYFIDIWLVSSMNKTPPTPYIRSSLTSAIKKDMFLNKCFQDDWGICEPLSFLASNTLHKKILSGVLPA